MRYWFKFVLTQFVAVLTVAALASAYDLPGNTAPGMPTPEVGTTSAERIASPNDAYQFRLLPAGSALWQGLSTAAIKGNYAYCMMVEGLEIVDISNPMSPTRVKRTAIAGSLTGYESLVYGDLAVFACAGSGYRFFNISNPLEPVEVLKYATPTNATGLAMKGQYLITVDESNLDVFDLSNQSLPVHVGTRNWLGAPFDVTVRGDYAYVSADNYFWTVALANPAFPTIVDYKSEIQYGTAATLGNYLYVLDATDNCRVYDLALPNKPAYVASFPVDASAYDLSANGGNLIVAYSDGVRIYDMSNPTQPTVIGTAQGTGSGRLIPISSNQLMISNWYDGFKLVDISNPAQPAAEGAYLAPGMGAKIERVGNYIFEANGNRGLQVIDVSDGANPNEVALLDTPGDARDVFVVGNTLFLADYGFGLRIIDISAPLSPQEIGFFATTGYGPIGVVVDGNLAYVCGGTDYGLKIVDISNLAAPTLVSSLPTAWGFQNVAYSNGIVAGVTYVPYPGDGLLYIIDVSNPAAPTILSSVDIGLTGIGVDIKGSLVYAMDMYYGLSIYDITNPAQPALVGALELPRHTRDVHVEGNYAYVANYTSGVGIVDVSNPAAPTLAAFYYTRPVWIFDVRVSGNVLFACGDNAFLTFYLDGCRGPDGSGVNNISDVVFLINYIFASGPAPNPTRAGDLNCDEILSISDAVLLINYIFASGPAPCGGC